MANHHHWITHLPPTLQVVSKPLGMVTVKSAAVRSVKAREDSTLETYYRCGEVPTSSRAKQPKSKEEHQWPCSLWCRSAYTVRRRCNEKHILRGGTTHNRNVLEYALSKPAPNLRGEPETYRNSRPMSSYKFDVESLFVARLVRLELSLVILPSVTAAQIGIAGSGSCRVLEFCDLLNGTGEIFNVG